MMQASITKSPLLYIVPEILFSSDKIQLEILKGSLQVNTEHINREGRDK